MVLRYITSELPTLDELGMPEQLKDLVMLRRGLILMVGATGAGKSTTLAAMINHRNEKTSSHIITIEDPIEFLHPNKQSIINQREVGLDTKSYQRALKSAVRAAPDVIQIGEIRDTESMRAALDMAGTGHLVLATVHSNNAPETLDRIINLFPQEQHGQVFMDLAHYLRAILSQRLVRSRNGKRVAAVELMLNTPHIKDLILKGDISAVKEAHKDSGEQGMVRLSTMRCWISTRRARSRWTRLCRTPIRAPTSKPRSTSAANARSLTRPRWTRRRRARPRRRASSPGHRRIDFDRAAGATADGAGHEFFQRYLARQVVFCGQCGDGL